MSGPVAVLGAGGFIGNRTVEALHLSGTSVVPIVRRPSGLALPCRFDLPVRVADALSQSALVAAFAGCDAVVVAIAGDPRTIVDFVAPVYRAADAARVRRIVYLSSASVHGQSPMPGTDETSPTSDRQRLEYNNAKVRAERVLSECRENGTTETVVLRPAIVYGPRSQWTGGLADDLLSGAAALVDGGHGICNAVYVDNVVHAIRLALASPSADAEAFLIGDREMVTWRDLYRPITEALGVDLERVPTPPRSSAEHGVGRAERLRTSSTLRALLPRPVRAGLKAAYLASRREEASTSGTTQRVTLEQALLHTCSYQLPWVKARAQLGYEPIVSFDEGCRRSVAWLEFAGYPVGRMSS